MLRKIIIIKEKVIFNNFNQRVKIAIILKLKMIIQKIIFQNLMQNNELYINFILINLNLLPLKNTLIF